MALSMKLTDRFSPTQLIAPPWAVYAECAEVIGQILSNDFDRRHHEHVYEHVRHSHDELRPHVDEIIKGTVVPDLDGTHLDPEARDIDPLHDEEYDVYRAMLLDERHKRLNVIGDVGVGKSTFIQHLISRHLGKNGFPGRIAIYLDWSDFSPGLENAMVFIRRFFVDRVLSELERHKSKEDLMALNWKIFQTAEMFAVDRVIYGVQPEADRPSFYASAITRALGEETQIDFIHAQLDALCEDDPNAVVLIIDNIDHLPARTLTWVFRFLTALQVKTKPLLIVGMRDHTYLLGRSAYSPDRIAMAWRMRLNPPNLRRLLQRRIEYFFAEPFDDLVASRQIVGTLKDPMLRRVQIGGGSHMDLNLKQVCRRLLDATIADANTRDFVFSFSNYNIRELFAVLQRILNCPGHGAFDGRLVLDQDFQLGIDQCVIALGLDQFLMFFPQKSQLFNPYSAGADVEPTDKLIGVRLLQMLRPLQRPKNFREIKACFDRWGYRADAVKTQMEAMVHKDLVWTTTGAPADFSDDSGVMLSYRGGVYVNRLLGRAIFNYMMAFDVDLDPAAGSPIQRLSRKEIADELGALARFDRTVQVDTLAERVLELAATIYNAERCEVETLTSSQSLRSFRAEVAPSCIAANMVDGLQKFMVAVVEKRHPEYRFSQPSSAMMKQVSKLNDDYQKSFSHYW